MRHRKIMIGIAVGVALIVAATAGPLTILGQTVQASASGGADTNDTQYAEYQSATQALDDALAALEAGEGDDVIDLLPPVIDALLRLEALRTYQDADRRVRAVGEEYVEKAENELERYKGVLLSWFRTVPSLKAMFEERIAEDLYQTALAYASEGDYGTAIQGLRLIANYRDAKELKARWETAEQYRFTVTDAVGNPRNDQYESKIKTIDKYIAVTGDETAEYLRAYTLLMNTGTSSEAAQACAELVESAQGDPVHYPGNTLENIIQSGLYGWLKQAGTPQKALEYLKDWQFLFEADAYSPDSGFTIDWINFDRIYALTDDDLDLCGKTPNGKVLICCRSKASSGVYTYGMLPYLMVRMPASALPESLEEVEYIIWVDDIRELIGYYGSKQTYTPSGRTNALAVQVSRGVILQDFTPGRRGRENVGWITGGMPPETTTKTKGDICGDIPEWTEVYPYVELAFDRLFAELGAGE